MQVATVRVPAHLWKAHEALDEALVLFSRIKHPEAPREEVLFHLRAALRHAYAALAESGDAQKLRQHSDTGLGRSRIALVLLEAWEAQAGTFAAPAADALRTAVTAWGQPQGTLEVQLGLPKVQREGQNVRAAYREPVPLTRSREVLNPAVILPEVEPIAPTVPEIPPEPDGTQPTPTSLSELMAQTEAIGRAAEAMQKRATAKKPPPPEPERSGVPDDVLYSQPLKRDEVEWRRAQELFEELAMLGGMRRPFGAWRESGSPEERLLARVEGLVACGSTVWPRLVEYLSDRPVPDPDLLWAAIFFFGSFAEDDARDQVLRLLRTAGLDSDALWDAATDAVLLAPQPGVHALLPSWLDRGGWEARMAARILGRRRRLSTDRILALLLPDSGSSNAATDAVLRTELAAGLRGAPGDLGPREVSALLRMEDPAIVDSLLAALVHRHSHLGAALASDFTRTGRAEFGGAARWNALIGGPKAAADFTAALAKGMGPVLLDGLGWYGSIQFIEPLLEALPKNPSAADALQRLTGASITDADPDPDYEEGEEPFTPGHRPDLPALELSRNPEAWRHWWRKHGKRARPEKRYRFGRPWSFAENYWEMADAEISGPERERAHAEWVARTQSTYPLDVWDFVVRQEAQLKMWRDQLGHDRTGAGEWPTATRRA
ncbi:MAG: hypothetical protein ACKVPX_08620 [Myxococcaceae bacterium]